MKETQSVIIQFIHHVSPYIETDIFVPATDPVLIINVLFTFKKKGCKNQFILIFDKYWEILKVSSKKINHAGEGKEHILKIRQTNLHTEKRTGIIRPKKYIFNIQRQNLN